MDTKDTETEVPGLWASRGTAQEKRLPYPLQEDYILPFERSFEEEIAVVARLIQSISESGHHSSLFQSMIAAEPAIALAEILSLAEKIPPRGVSFHYDTEKASDTKTSSVDELKSIIYDRFKLLRSSDGVHLHNLGDSLPITTLDNSIATGGYENPITESLPEHLPIIRAHLASRLESGEIDPALGLLLATVKVLVEVKSRLNRFPDELLDLYYLKLLGLSPKQAAPAIALVSTSANRNPVFIRKGTNLTAFIADDLKMQATTASATRVVAASVQKIAQVRYWRDRTLTPVNTLGMITSVGAEQVSEKSVQLFSPTGPTATGLHIESPVLSLAQGRREIDIQIKLTSRQRYREFGTNQLEGLIAALAREPTIRNAFNASNSEEAVDTLTNILKMSGNLTTTEQPADQILAALQEHTGKELKFKNIIHAIVTDVLRSKMQETADDNAIAAVANDKAIRSEFNYTNVEMAVEAITKSVDQLGYVTGTNNPSDQVLAALLQIANTEAQVKVVLQRIVADVLLSKNHVWPTKIFLEIITDAANRVGLPDLLAVIGNRNSADLFHALLGDAFNAELSSEEGPIEPSALYVSACSNGSSGIRIQLLLDRSAPPVAAPAGHTAPYVQIKLSPDARYSPLSLFDERALESIEIGVTAQGLTQLTAFNDDGPVAVSQTVLPFGTEAKDNSEFLIGCPELATKSVESLRLNYTLADLPPLPRDGSLDTHYDGYGPAFQVPDPEIESQYLNADGWVPLSPPGPLIRGAQIRSALHRKGVIQGRIASPSHAPSSGTTNIDFTDRHAIRSGLIKVRLNTSGRNFGIHTYPLALADAIRKNQIPLRKAVTINPPLMMKFTELTLDYSARSNISINTPASASNKEVVTQLCPFGERQLYPDSLSGGATLFPQRLADGSLYIGMGPKVTPGPISLLFDLDNSGRERLPGAINTIQWHWLTHDGWQPMSSNSVLSDGTAGLQCSGVITFELPTNIDWNSIEMPAGMCWLAASTNHRLDTFPVLNYVSLNGIEVHVQDPPSKDMKSARWTFDPAIPGLAEISRVCDVDYVHSNIDRKSLHRARISEGLRHRQRGVHAWDIERLVLDAFPAVWKCKCFTARDGLNASVRAGHITVIVIPHAPRGESITSTAKMFDSPTLTRIKQHVQKRTNAFTEVTVRNPSFERLQVRALVAFDLSDGSGALINTLSREVSDQLSTWTAKGPMADLGWSLNINDLASFVESKPYISALKSFEILHLIHLNAENRHTQEDNFVLHDSVSTPSRAISHKEIWSLPLPMSHHLITPTEPDAMWDIKPAGIGQLAVGETLLVDNTRA